MSMVYVGYLGILLMLSLSVLGMPMAYAMCVVASMGLSLTLGPVNATTQSIFVMWEQASNFSLMSIPLFIFMGTIAFHSGIVGNLFIAFRRWIGFLPGGLAAAGVMAAGAFVQGSSIELSADGPIKPPYAVYFQGGITWYHSKYGIMMSLEKLVEAGIVDKSQIIHRF